MITYVNQRKWNLFVYLFITIAFSFDIIVDYQDGLPLSHLWHEFLLFCLSFFSLLWQTYVLYTKYQQLENLKKELVITKVEYQAWREKSKHSAQEIRRMIDEQFESWGLTQSERDVALLLIKGFTMIEIAKIRETKEKTVRQQATSIYKKAQLSGRQELSAFFLEDILSLS
jgi:DNA-binding CsgD family transcriptional regulator